MKRSYPRLAIMIIFPRGGNQLRARGPDITSAF
jgi:hypothetical protein